ALLAGGLPAAAMSASGTGTHWGLYNSSLDQTLAAFAPGTVLAAALADLAATQGFEVFDFLRGDEAYKYRFGAVDRPIEQARLVRH
ncbi:MAG: CelD/BcsL family acetyltransferase involved in cellulose biosynthesis, partial [Glaciecola sp.]